MKLDEKTLLKILKDEETDASAYYDSELASVQAEAMRRYHAAPYGTEREGRSRVVTHDVEDAINWMMPDLMRTFLSSDDLISIEDETSDDEQMPQDVSNYLSHVFFKDNAGDVLLHDFAFDGLLQRMGVMRVGWEDPKWGVPREYRGLAPEHLAQIMQDPCYEVIEQDVDEETEQISIKARKRPKTGRVRLDVIPPEEYAFARRSASGDSCDYKRWKREQFLGDVLAMFPDKRDDLVSDERVLSAASHDDYEDDVGDARRYERFPDEDATGSSNPDDHFSRRKVWLIHEEILIDYDGDGVTERRSIYRVGDVILENEEIERTMYHEWSPIRVAHRLAGRSISDTLLDIQRIRTEITRLTLDGLAQTLVQRTAANISKLEEGGYDALLDADIGGVVPVKGDPREVIMPLTTPDVSASAYPMLEYWDQRSEEASGVTRHSQGLRAEAITDTRGGIAMLQAAAKGRIELVARWLGKGLEAVFESILHLIVSHQDQPRLIKINGRPMPIDPTRWSDEMSVTIHVGMAGEDRQTKLGNLGIIAAKQEQILTTAGTSNPMVTIKQYRDTLALMAVTMGFKDADRFFAEIPDDYEPPQAEQQQDPKVLEAQAKMQLEQQKTQAQMQMEQQKAQSQMQIEVAKMQMEERLAAARMESEERIAFARMDREDALARERMAREMELAAYRATSDVKIKAESNGGARPGGRLDQ